MPDKRDDDDIINAAVVMIGRTGARNLMIGHSNAHQPPVWFAVASYREAHEAGGGMTALKAVLRLLDELIDGGECSHCKRPTGVVVELGTMPFADEICWYQYDPELRTFRRGCE